MDDISDEATTENVNDIVSQLGSIFNISAEKCKIKRTARSSKCCRKLRKKPWFNVRCETKRKAFFIAKNNVRANDNVAHKNVLKNSSKEYKKQLCKEQKLYFKEVNEKLKNLSSTDPKEFWKIINKSNDSDGNVNNAPDIQEFTDHFAELNDGNVIPDDTEDYLKRCADLNSNDVLDKPITEEEVLYCIKRLRNNKAMGDDLILNEYIKSSADILKTIYVKLFNVILNSGKIPESWSRGVILPLYKKKGSKANVDNYRGITIMSCLGKLFTSIVNVRLTKFTESIELIGAQQAGFRKGYSTMDHVFTFKCLLDLYLSKKKKLYCAFIDYRKAFDSVDRVSLWKKLLSGGINGKLFNIVFNMYKQAKSCVRVNGSKSDFFNCLAGVRQGENLSPLLFAIFLCDLEISCTTNMKVYLF